MADQILIRQLRADAVIGIHDWEKRHPQPLYFDLDLSTDCARAAASDDIADALDYFAVCADIQTWVSHSRCELIETLAEQICQRLLAQYPIDQVQLTLHKPQAVEDAQTVGLRITRRRS
jgi:dihydroneopterin aldolase